jgi:L-alanine-DL-glutamate epimerase-like enolase superfamily enzyme
MQVRFHKVEHPYAAIFRIAYRAKTCAATVVVELQNGELIGRGEGLGVAYHGETVESMLDQLATVASDLRGDPSRQDLAKLLPAGGARNAIDCAMWDLESKQAGRRAWELAGFSSVRALSTDYTLGLDTPAAMAQSALEYAKFSILKVKMNGDGDLARLRAIREARPDVALIVDANQAWNEAQLREFLPHLCELKVQLIEQPLRAGQDEALLNFKSPIPLCADESCQTTDSLQSILGKYEYWNIKLDKTGGLTEALRLAQQAKSADVKLMVGCMGGSSLSMAPAFIVGQVCDFIDLDGPLRLKADVRHAIRYEGDRMFAPEQALWG